MDHPKFPLLCCAALLYHPTYSASETLSKPKRELLRDSGLCCASLSWRMGYRNNSICFYRKPAQAGTHRGVPAIKPLCVAATCHFQKWKLNLTNLIVCQLHPVFTADIFTYLEWRAGPSVHNNTNCLLLLKVWASLVISCDAAFSTFFIQCKYLCCHQVVFYGSFISQSKYWGHIQNKISDAQRNGLNCFRWGNRKY